jgi:hypothetical protein
LIVELRVVPTESPARSGAFCLLWWKVQGTEIGVRSAAAVSVTMAVVVIALIVAVSVSVSAVVVIVASAVIVVIFILAVVVAVVVANFFAIFAGVEVPLPAAMTAPVGVFAADREWAVVAEARIVRAIDVAAESQGPVKPGTGSEEDSTGKPGRSVIAERSASIGRVVVIAVRAGRLDADVDGDLGV